MATGTVKKFFPKFSYGFIVSDLGGRDIFFCSDDQDIWSGDRVSFEEHISKDGTKLWATDFKIGAKRCRSRCHAIAAPAVSRLLLDDRSSLG